MKKILIAIFTAIIAVSTLSACETEPGSQGVNGDCGLNWEGTVCPAVIEYEGHDLHCFKSGVHGGVTLTCDYVRYWQENKR